MVFLNSKYSSTNDLSFTAAIFIVMVFSALLVTNRRYILQAQRDIYNNIIQYHKETYAKIDTEINTIGQVIDIQKKARFDPVVMELIISYTHITEPDLSIFKNTIMEEARERLRQLEEDKCTDLLEPKEGFDLSIPKLDNLTADDTVRAVTFLYKDTEGLDMWKEYYQSNKTAADRGATVNRIFIISETVLLDAYKNEDGKKDGVVRSHTKGYPWEGSPWPENNPEQNEVSSNLNGFYLEKSLFDKEDPRIKDMVGEGFMMINYDILMKDRFIEINNSGKHAYKQIACYHQERNKRLAHYFDILKSQSKPLDKKLIFRLSQNKSKTEYDEQGNIKLDTP